MRSKLNLASDHEINKEIKNAINSTEEFIVWLEEESSKKTGPSGIGKENYTWYQKMYTCYQ